MILPDNVAGHTLASLLRLRTMAAPKKIALVGNSPRLGARHVTYGHLLAEAQRLAAAFIAMGLEIGDRVGVMLGNDAGYEAVISMAAVHEFGGIFVPVNARFAIEEIVYVLNKADCRVLIALDAAARRVESVRDRTPGLRRILVVDGAVQETSDWHRIIASHSADARRVLPRVPADIAEILFTSGTTARPKGAMMTHQSAVASSYSMASAVDITPDDVFQSFMPFFTTGGVRCLVHASLWAGATAVLDPELDVQSIARRMSQECTTVYMGTPAFYIFLLEQIGDSSNLLSGLRKFIFGGAPTSAETISRVAEAFPKVELCNAFGPTESGPGGTVARGREVLERPNTIGRPWELVELKLVNDDDNEVETGTRGEICTRGPLVMQGYWGDPERTAEALKGGWLHTGDIGVLDSDGFLQIVDRKKDMLIRGGHNIASLEVEAVLAQHPAIAEAAVVGAPHPKLGEDIHAFVTLRSDRSTTVDEIREFCVDKLADYKRPRRITITASLPRGPMGKVLKSELRLRAIEIGA